MGVHRVCFTDLQLLLARGSRRWRIKRNVTVPVSAGMRSNGALGWIAGEPKRAVSNQGGGAAAFLRVRGAVADVV